MLVHQPQRCVHHAAKEGHPRDVLGRGYRILVNDAPLLELIAEVRARLDRTVAAALERTWAQVDAYASSAAHELREDVRAHVDAVFRAVLTAMEEGRRAVPADFPMTGSQAARRVRQGIGLSDFLRAFRVNQVQLWESILDVATSNGSREIALTLATQVMEVIEVGSSVAAESYVAAQQAQLVESDRLRRDLVEALLLGNELPPGRNAEFARFLALDASSSLLVITAVAVASDTDSSIPPSQDAITAVGGALSEALGSLVVWRQEELVALARVGRGERARVIARVERTQRRLEREGLVLAVGISTWHDGVVAAPRAYAEALLARGALRGRAGTCAMPQMKTFDYLVLRDDPTALRLVREDLRRFIEEDQGRGGTLTDTFLAYVMNDLNARETASTMHLHPNSAYYRLEKIRERTGLDLRSFSDVLELLVAVSLLRHSDRPSVSELRSVADSHARSSGLVDPPSNE